MATYIMIFLLHSVVPVKIKEKQILLCSNVDDNYLYDEDDHDIMCGLPAAADNIRWFLENCF